MNDAKKSKYFTKNEVKVNENYAFVKPEDHRRKIFHGHIQLHELCIT